MSAFRRLSAACATVLVASGLVVAPFLTGPAAAAELIQDGGFEAATGDPPNSPTWTEADSERGTPLCSTSALPDLGLDLASAHAAPTGPCSALGASANHTRLPVPDRHDPARDRHR